MKIQLTFENALYVSQALSGLDKLRILNLKSDFFISSSSGLGMPAYISTQGQIPKQISNNEQNLLASFKGIANILRNGTNAIFGSNFIIQVAFSGSLAVLWGIINSL